jgi:hypothetical protein
MVKGSRIATATRRGAKSPRPTRRISVAAVAKATSFRQRALALDIDVADLDGTKNKKTLNSMFKALLPTAQPSNDVELLKESITMIRVVRATKFQRDGEFEQWSSPMVDTIRKALMFAPDSSEEVTKDFLFRLVCLTRAPNPPQEPREMSPDHDSPVARQTQTPTPGRGSTRRNLFRRPDEPSNRGYSRALELISGARESPERAAQRQTRTPTRDAHENVNSVYGPPQAARTARQSGPWLSPLGQHSPSGGQATSGRERLPTQSTRRSGPGGDDHERTTWTSGRSSLQHPYDIPQHPFLDRGRGSRGSPISINSPGQNTSLRRSPRASYSAELVSNFGKFQNSHEDYLGLPNLLVTCSSLSWTDILEKRCTRAGIPTPKHVWDLQARFAIDVEKDNLDLQSLFLGLATRFIPHDSSALQAKYFSTWELTRKSLLDRTRETFLCPSFEKFAELIMHILGIVTEAVDAYSSVQHARQTSVETLLRLQHQPSQVCRTVCAKISAQSEDCIEIAKGVARKLQCDATRTTAARGEVEQKTLLLACSQFLGGLLYPGNAGSFSQLTREITLIVMFAPSNDDAPRPTARIPLLTQTLTKDSRDERKDASRTSPRRRDSWGSSGRESPRRRERSPARHDYRDSNRKGYSYRQPYSDQQWRSRTDGDRRPSNRDSDRPSEAGRLTGSTAGISSTTSVLPPPPYNPMETTLYQPVSCGILFQKGRVFTSLLQGGDACTLPACSRIEKHFPFECPRRYRHQFHEYPPGFREHRESRDLVEHHSDHFIWAGATRLLRPEGLQAWPRYIDKNRIPTYPFTSTEAGSYIPDFTSTLAAPSYPVLHRP